MLLATSTGLVLMPNHHPRAEPSQAALEYNEYGQPVRQVLRRVVASPPVPRLVPQFGCGVLTSSSIHSQVGNSSLFEIPVTCSLIHIVPRIR